MILFNIPSRPAVLLLIITFSLINFQSVLTQNKIFFIHDRDTRIQSADLNGENLQDLVFARLDGALDIVADPENEMIFWSETGKVFSYDLNSNKINLLRNYAAEGAFTTNISAVAFDGVNNKLYWINAGEGKIERSNPDGSGFEVVFTSNLQVSSTYSLALDPDSKKIYWSGIEYIRRVGYDGTQAEDIVTDDIFAPEGIFVDTVNDKLYWADLVGNVIKRSNLDGSEAEDVYSGDLENPADIVVSDDGAKLFLIDRGSFGDEGIILGVNSDGSGESEIFNDLDDPIALTLYENRLFWLDDSSPVILAGGNIDGSSRDTLVSEISNFENLTLAASEVKLFWFSSGGIYSSDLDGGNSEIFIETNSVNDIIYDVVNQLLYWSESNAIRRVKAEGGEIENLITSEVDDPDYVALDTEGGKIYWIDGGYNAERIKWANLDGSGNNDLITNLDQPVDLNYNSRTGKIYWREGGTFSTLLLRADKDGTNMETVIEDGSVIQSYYVSENTDKLFWSARDISSAASDGGSALKIVDEDWQSYSLAVDPNSEKVYWYTEDNDFHVIKRADFDGSSVERIIEGLPVHIYRELILYGNGITGINQQSFNNSGYSLSLYPNPFRNNSTVQFTIPEEAMVEISFFNISGKRIRTIINEKKYKGKHAFMFESENLPPGMYFIRLQSNGIVNTTRMVIAD